MNESIKSITDSVTSIHQTLLDQQELDKDKQDDIDIDAEQDTRDAKESSREGGSSIGKGLQKAGAKMLAPVTNAFDKIKEWLFKFFAAKAIMMFIKWFSDPTNAKKVSSLFRFIKDWWPAILTGILLFCGVDVRARGNYYRSNCIGGRIYSKDYKFNKTTVWIYEGC